VVGVAHRVCSLTTKTEPRRNHDVKPRAVPTVIGWPHGNAAQNERGAKDDF
jgi:hypothetical protein